MTLRPTTVLLASLLASGLFLSCARKAPTDLYVVVPAATDGHVGAVVVSDGLSEQLLDRAYAGLELDADGTARPVVVSQARVQQVFGAALAAAPFPPRTFTLEFAQGSQELTAASEEQLPAIRGDLARRGVAVEVEVIGHTDRVGAADQNQLLSEARAHLIRDWLVANGVDPAVIQAYGRGERDPLLPTDDDVNEPRNRRVEVTVR